MRTNAPVLRKHIKHVYERAEKWSELKSVFEPGSTGMNHQVHHHHLTSALAGYSRQFKGITKNTLARISKMSRCDGGLDCRGRNLNSDALARRLHAKSKKVLSTLRFD